MYIFRDGDKVTYALVYVDDILFMGNDATFRNLCKLALVAKFRKITEQPTNSLTFLGMKIQKLRNGDITVYPDFDGSAAIIVKSTKHHSTADSSTEAELMALHEAMKYITWIADVYLELGYETRPIETFQDNKSCITLSSEESINFRGRSKFINRKYFGIYQHLQDGDAILTHLGTESMIADVLTKAIVGEKFRNFTISLMGKPS